MNLTIENKYFKKNISLVAGIDEAGRGPIAGPVVAACVVYDQASLKNSFNKKINDSKKLTPKLRQELFAHILQSALSVGIGIVDEKTIDKINILQSTKEAINIALQNLTLKPEAVLVDGNFFTHNNFKIQNIVKGDSRSYIIAAASIIAKVTRDKIMVEYDKQFPEFGFAKHKGYGTIYHINAISKFGLSPLHRKTFHLKKLANG